MQLLKTCLVVGIISGVSACSGGSKSKTGPDEFSVVPTKPLVAPDDLSILPVPNVGAANLADKNPDSLAAQALGGNINTSGTLRSETSLLNSATRYGVDADIRSSLSREDALLRKRNPGRLLERWVNGKTTDRAYRFFLLNSDLELKRLRDKGVQTPTAPPPAE